MHHPNKKKKDGEKIREAKKKQGEFILHAIRNLINISLNFISIYHLSFSIGTHIICFFRLESSNLINGRHVPGFIALNNNQIQSNSFPAPHVSK